MLSLNVLKTGTGKSTTVSTRALFLVLASFLSLILSASSPKADFNPWILVDASNGNVLAHHQADRPWHPASITKIMTAYTVFRQIKAGHIDQKSPVRISSKALALPPSKMGFPVGTILNVDTAIKIIMVKSANDVSAALGESVAGSLKKFMQQMNEEAKRLGMHNTHFDNPHGLHSVDQVTTARDMAILALAVQNEFPQYADYFNISAIRFGKRRLKNHNGLIYNFPGTNGMKTGYTCPSGLNIVARAKQNGKELIAVVLGGYSSVERNVLTARILQDGFDGKFNIGPYPSFNFVKTFKAPTNLYAVPANLRPVICKPSWSERRMTKKQRRKKRKTHLTNLKQLKDTYLSRPGNPGPTIKVTLGNAFGLNPYKFKLKNGSTPQKVVSAPVWRPDRSIPPYEEVEELF